MIERRKVRCQRAMAAILTVAAFLIPAPKSHAALIIAAQSVTDSAGTMNGIFDVTLTNTGGSAVTLGGFSFGIQVGTPNLTFTAVDTSTASPYVFGVNSVFGPDISVQPPTLPGQILEVEDIGATGASIAGGTTVGLGEVHFNLDAGATGNISISFIDVDNSLYDENATNLDFTASNGTVTVGTSAPEPALGGLAGFATLALIVYRFRRRSAWMD